MKKFFTIMCVCLIASFANAQTTNGTGGGNWSAAATWAGGVVPTGSGTITIAATDSIIYDVPVTITGTLVKNSTKKDSIAAGGSVTFANGSIYQHAVNGGSIPIATWATGSTCKITGATTSGPGNNDQAFYNFIWACQGQAASINLTWGVNSARTINGNVTVTSSGTSLANQFRLTNSNVANNITINGNFVVNPDAGFVAYASPSGSATTKEIIVSVLGDVSISGGTSTIWAISNNSSATWTWKLYGNLTVASVCSLRVSGTGKIVFAKTGKQTFTVPSDVITASTLTGEVLSGSTLDMGTSLFNGNTFTLDAGGGLATAAPTGLVANFKSGATNTLNTACNFTFNGSAAQVTSTLMPATARTVTINNAAGVTSSQPLTITDTLFLTSGTLTGPYTATVTKTGGTNVDNSISLPQVFALNQNYPNPFNPATQISYNIPKESYVSLKVYNLMGQEVATLVSGNQTAGMHNVSFDASHLSSGVYMYRLQAGSSVEVKRMMFVK